MFSKEDERRRRVERRRQCLEDAVRAKGLHMTSDKRIFLDVAAVVVGISKGHLQNQISKGKGPAFYTFAGEGRRVSIDIADLASWVEDQRHESK